jgi:hypothetical protein
MKVFTIVAKGFEYNDNYMYETESGGGNPVHAYFSEEKAHLQCKVMNIASIRSLDSLGDYGWLEHDRDDLKEMREICGLDEDDYSLPDLTDEQAEKMYGLLGDYFYYVVQIEVEDAIQEDPPAPTEKSEEPDEDNRFDLDLE